MKNFWKKTKKQVTLSVAKVKDTVATDAKKKETEDPAFIEQTVKLNALRDQCGKIIRALTVLGKEIESLYNIYSVTANTFSDIISSDCEPYHQYSSKSQEGINQMQTYAHNFSAYYLKYVQMKPLFEMNDELTNLKTLREKRKKNKVLLQQEEAHLKSAQEKNKDVDRHIEKTRLRREKYERYNTQFLTGVALIHDRSPEVFGKSFDIYQFYMAELIELQQKCLVQNMANFPFDTLRSQIPSCTTKPQLLSSSTTPPSSTGGLPPIPQQPISVPPYQPPIQPIQPMPTVQPTIYDPSISTQPTFNTQLVQPIIICDSPIQQIPQNQPPPLQQIQTTNNFDNNNNYDQIQPGQNNVPLNPYSASDTNMLPNSSNDFPL